MGPIFLFRRDWNISRASYNSKSSATNGGRVVFRPNGASFYVIDNSNVIHQYGLSIDWDWELPSDLPTYTSKTLDCSSEDSQQRGFYIKPDGTALYVVGDTTDSVYQYSLSTAWDVSTGSYASKSVSVTSQDTVPIGVAFKPDGSTMYMVGQVTAAVYQYTLSTPWDVSTASYASKTLDVSSQDLTPINIQFVDAGRTMLMVGNTNDTIFQYSLSTPWDVSTGTYTGYSLDVSGRTTSPTGVAAHHGGGRLIVSGGTTIYGFE